MKDIELSKELRESLENNQMRLKSVIFNHQNEDGEPFRRIFAKLQDDPDNLVLQKEFSKAEEEIVLVGLEQKTILEKLRAEFKVHNKTTKANICKNGIEERKQNLTSALVRTRKQNIILKPSPQASFSEESNEASSGFSSPERVLPLEPHDVSQSKFLAYFGLATHEAYREMQNRRVERKRRSTANPHFLYGNKGWDLGAKRKRGNYLASSFSPPNTRQSVRKRNERSSPPSSENGAVSIPNLPTGLTIERVSPSSSPDLTCCTACKQSSGNLLVCEICQNGFHLTCHNRPLPQPPRKCPRCIAKDASIGLLMPARVSPTLLAEKNEEKQKLQDENDNLCAKLTELQDRHSELSVSLKNQKDRQEELVSDSQNTEEKIKSLLSFINTIKTLSTINADSD